MPAQPFGMANTDHKSPTAAANSGAGTAWTNPTNVYADDNANAVTGAITGDSQNLDATGFGFAVPADARITGVSVAIARHNASGPTNHVVDKTVQLLVYDGSAQAVHGSNQASATEWPTTETIRRYGGALDNWGAILNPTNVNHANFGVRMTVTCTAADARIDWIGVRIHYRTRDGSVRSELRRLRTPGAHHRRAYRSATLT